MFKKIIACILSLAMICCTSISAKALETDEPSVPDAPEFKLMLEGQSNTVGFSASVISHNFSATRLDDGKVRLIINETFNSVRGYYEHMATDSTGQYFIPSKNTAYYTELRQPTSYEVILNADTVSTNGYIYLKFKIAPVGVDYDLGTIYYKIPVK
ncbi:hypothetical protein [Thomasclavelia spiroformis]|uniref:hypothetical protein n=1 Tax=Thomasclavelia spiroformis TaxID=29348 RepID=UPI00241FA19E|nr:hypothetical protein [Thomasclavelia spiroformis]MBS6114605.1 hypothetical protein [Thomasclavelia spiroformis]